MDIQRTIQPLIESKLFKGKVILIIGARQVGKSTLLKQITRQRNESVLFLECDDPVIRQTLTDINLSEIRDIIGQNKIIVIDEAQLIPNIGRSIKLIVDNVKDIQIIVSGSSAFELHNKLNEPLTGRKFEYRLYPISTEELVNFSGLLSVKQNLEQRLIFGSYPDIIMNKDDVKDLLMNITESYLYKDVLTIDNLRKPVLINKLLTALALQLGSEISYNELAKTIGSDSKTVEKYIDLLEKCYVIFRLSAFSRNLRSELKKSKKVYFYDNGIRNTILRNYAPLELRNDVGALWENFFISERIKYNHYHNNYANYYFWRTTQQQEIDFVEEYDGKFNLFEMKWNPKKAKVTIPKIFKETYEIREFNVVTPQNYLEFVR
ncbi:MAG: ATP-binding protein [Bacteroidales bacterium]|nr:ATP-binding protein [Bacteroidales bacterium]